MDWDKTMLCALIAIALSSLTSSQTAEIKVQILNTPPKAYNVYAANVVKTNQSAVVWCTGVLEDLNSFKDFKTETAFIGISSNGGYIQRRECDFIDVYQTSVTQGTVLAGFVVGPEAAAGEWSCVIEGADNADAKATNKTSFMIYPQTCDNKIMDSGETNIDCGGPCTPCTCFNGVQDEGEADADCGGPCTYCTGKGTLSLAAPNEVTAGEVITVQVSTGGNRGMKSLVRATKPNGETIVFNTDDSGMVTLTSDEAGEWRIKAELYGYRPAEARVQVKTPVTPYILAAVAVLALAVLALVTVKSRRKQ